MRYRPSTVHVGVPLVGVGASLRVKSSEVRAIVPALSPRACRRGRRAEAVLPRACRWR
jgi:hypothetical protein